MCVVSNSFRATTFKLIFEYEKMCFKYFYSGGRGATCARIRALFALLLFITFYRLLLTVSVCVCVHTNNEHKFKANINKIVNILCARCHAHSKQQQRQRQAESTRPNN